RRSSRSVPISRWFASPTRPNAGSASPCSRSTRPPSGTDSGPTASRTRCGVSARSCGSTDRRRASIPLDSPVVPAVRGGSARPADLDGDPRGTAEAAAGGGHRRVEGGPMTSRPLNVFISYAHEDEPFKDRLIKHLAILQHEQLISAWQDRMIVAGE